MGARCGCGCTTTITAASPSTLFATERCQRSWNLRRIGQRLPEPEAPVTSEFDDPWADVFGAAPEWPGRTFTAQKQT